MYKVKYQINMLSMLEKYAVLLEDGTFEYQNPNINFMKMIINSDELEIFESSNVENLIQYKWNKFAQKLHFTGFLFHFFYLTVMTIFVKQIYVDNDLDNKHNYCYILIIGIIYPTWYDLFQMYRLGIKAYFAETTNWINIIYTLAGIGNVII